MSGSGLLLLHSLRVCSNSSIDILKFRFIWSRLFGSMFDLICMFLLGTFISFINFFFIYFVVEVFVKEVPYCICYCCLIGYGALDGFYKYVIVSD